MTSSPLYYYMTALSKSNASLISHILQIHSVVTVELEGDSCFELYCNSRNDIIISLLTTEIEKMLERDEESSSGSLDSLVFLHGSVYFIDTRYSTSLDKCM